MQKYKEKKYYIKCFEYTWCDFPFYLLSYELNLKIIYINNCYLSVGHIVRETNKKNNEAGKV